LVETPPIRGQLPEKEKNRKRKKQEENESMNEIGSTLLAREGQTSFASLSLHIAHKRRQVTLVVEL
jgi:hypothetical protein